LVVPLLLFIAILQTTIVPHLAIWGVFPNLPLLIVVSWSLLQGARKGIIWGFVAGLAVDLLSGAPVGTATLSLMAASLMAGLGRATIFQTFFAMSLVAMFLATAVYGLCFMLILQISGQHVDWLNSLLRIVLPSALLNALLTPIVFGLMRWLYLRFGQKEMEW
jgi:rod shape-determining protein MreD